MSVVMINFWLMIFNQYSCHCPPAASSSHPGARWQVQGDPPLVWQHLWHVGPLSLPSDTPGQQRRMSAARRHPDRVHTKQPVLPSKHPPDTPGVHPDGYREAGVDCCGRPWLDAPVWVYGNRGHIWNEYGTHSPACSPARGTYLIATASDNGYDESYGSQSVLVFVNLVIKLTSTLCFDWGAFAKLLCNDCWKCVTSFCRSEGILCHLW